MKNRIVSLFCMGMLLFLSGCSVTASLNPPFDKRAETSPEPFLGEWICSTKTDTYAIRLSPLQGTGHAVRIRIQQTPRTPKERFRGTWIPLNGIFQTIRGEIFLIVAPATDEMLREADRNEQAGARIRQKVAPRQRCSPSAGTHCSELRRIPPGTSEQRRIQAGFELLSPDPEREKGNAALTVIPSGSFPARSRILPR